MELNLTTTEVDRQIDEAQTEYIFLLNCSQSINDEAFQMVKEEVINKLKNLPINSYFNICQCGGIYEFFFDSRSVKVCEQSVDIACQRLETLQKFGYTDSK